MTRIERWIANPYEIFARYILRLERDEELGDILTPPSAARSCTMALHEFALRHSPPVCRTMSKRELTRIADAHFARLGGAPLVEAFWRPAFRSASPDGSRRPSRRGGAASASSLTEVDGALDLRAGRGFRLTARADRIDVGEDGAAVIYDYKTGKPPTPKQVDDLYAPQLPLEAAIAAAADSRGLETCEVGGLVYISVSGRSDGGGGAARRRRARPSILAEKALDELSTLDRALSIAKTRPMRRSAGRRRPSRSLYRL